MKLNPPNPEAVREHRKRWEYLDAFRKSRRTQDEIVAELSSLIIDLKKEFFLPYISQMTTDISRRDTSQAFQHLRSPMRQLVYLIDLYISLLTEGDKTGLSKQEWIKITSLLDEIEMTYFADIGFYDDLQNHADLDKISVSLHSFVNYFFNAQLSYEEQTLERLEKNCGHFDESVKEVFGFTVSEAKIFATHIRRLTNNKFAASYHYALHPEEWSKLIQSFVDRGLKPEDMWNEPELALLKEYVTKPGLIFIHKSGDLYKVDLPQKVTSALIDFLTYDEDLKKGTTLYYADKSPYFDKPLVRLNKDEFLCPLHKFLVECFYNRINDKLSQIKKEKYTQFKNQMVEKKVAEIFRKLFGNEAQVFDSYYVDYKKSEQDLLIVFKGFYFIIEIKDTLFRAPMRDPLKAFDKIQSDFKKAIQNGYDQALRIERKFQEGEPFEIFDSASHKSLYKVIPSRAKDYFSIVVTQFKYGGIQTNLKNLLAKDDDALYPWSVCIDDLEVFVYALKKLKRGMARTQFIKYLKHREAFHEHLICGDELELCGYFMNSPDEFIELSTIEETFNADPHMSHLFDAEYYNGLGFENEIDINVKKYRKVQAYQKKWNFDILRGSDLNLQILNDKPGHE